MRVRDVVLMSSFVRQYVKITYYEYLAAAVEDYIRSALGFLRCLISLKGSHLYRLDVLYCFTDLL
jgi:hypothetical protein